MNVDLRIWIGKHEDGYNHVRIYGTGPVADELRAAIDGMMNLLAKGKEALIRTPTELDHYTEFDTKISQYSGFARFSYKDKPGEWQTMTKQDHDYIGFGALP